jgi:regulatory protein YycI of two-component signal transduction system YycFG
MKKIIFVFIFLLLIVLLTFLILYFNHKSVKPTYPGDSEDSDNPDDSEPEQPIKPEPIKPEPIKPVAVCTNQGEFCDVKSMCFPVKNELRCIKPIVEYNVKISGLLTDVYKKINENNKKDINIYGRHCFYFGSTENIKSYSA